MFIDKQTESKLFSFWIMWRYPCFVFFVHLRALTYELKFIVLVFTFDQYQSWHFSLSLLESWCYLLHLKFLFARPFLCCLFHGLKIHMSFRKHILLIFEWVTMKNASFLSYWNEFFSMIGTLLIFHLWLYLNIQFSILLGTNLLK